MRQPTQTLPQASLHKGGVSELCSLKITAGMGAHPHLHEHKGDCDVKVAQEDDEAHHDFTPDHSLDTDSTPRDSHHLYIDARSSFASTHSTKGDVSQEQRDTVRAALKGEACDDDMLCRFVHATGGNLPLVSYTFGTVC